MKGRYARAMAAAAGVLAAPALVFAAADEHGHGATTLADRLMSTEVWAMVLNFGLLVYALVRFGKRPIGEFLEKRRAEIEKSMKEAAAMKAKAEAKYNEYASRLAQIEREVETLRKDMMRAAEEEKHRIIAEAEARAERTRQETERVIQQEMERTQRELKQEVVEQAAQLARELLAQNIEAADQKRLAEAYLRGLAENVQPKQGKSQAAAENVPQGARP